MLQKVVGIRTVVFPPLCECRKACLAKRAVLPGISASAQTNEGLVTIASRDVCNPTNHRPKSFTKHSELQCRLLSAVWQLASDSSALKLRHTQMLKCSVCPAFLSNYPHFQPQPKTKQALIFPSFDLSCARKYYLCFE